MEKLQTQNLLKVLQVQPINKIQLI